MARRIIANRKRFGLFKSKEEFLSRIPTPKRIQSILSIAGAFKNIEDFEWEMLQEAYNA